MKTAGRRQHHHVTLDGKTKDDCRVWIQFLQEDHLQVVCRPFVDLSISLTAEEIRFRTDASGNETYGLGCVLI